MLKIITISIVIYLASLSSNALAVNNLVTTKFNSSTYGVVSAEIQQKEHEKIKKRFNQYINYFQEFNNLTTDCADDKFCIQRIANAQDANNREKAIGLITALREYLKNYKVNENGLTAGEVIVLKEDSKIALFNLLRISNSMNSDLNKIPLSDVGYYEKSSMFAELAASDNEMDKTLVKKIKEHIVNLKKKNNEKLLAEQVLVKKELGAVQTQILRGIKKDTNVVKRSELESRLAEINNEIIDKNNASNNSLNVSIDTYKLYPTITNRFYAGGTYTTGEDFNNELLPMVGLFYYRQPRPASADSSFFKNQCRVFKCSHFSFNVGLDSLVLENSEGDSKNEPAFRTNMMWMYPLAQFNADENKPLVFGGVIHLDLNGARAEDDDGSKSFKLHKRAWTGFRFAFSPEQYSELLIGNTIKKGGDEFEQTKTRVRLNLYMTTPFIQDSSKLQLGLTWDFRVKKNDPDDNRDKKDNMVKLTARYNTSFGRLFNDVFK